MIEPYDVMIDQELVQGSLRLVCAWHPKLFGAEKVMREAKPGHEARPASHGICPLCLARLKQEGRR